MMVKCIFLQSQKFRHALNTLRLRDGTCQHNNIRVWCQCMRPLNIQRCLFSPTKLVTAFGIERYTSQRRKLLNTRRIRQTITSIECLQVTHKRGTPIGVDDDDRLTLARKASLNEWSYIIRVTYLLWTITGSIKFRTTLCIR